MKPICLAIMGGLWLTSLTLAAQDAALPKLAPAPKQLAWTSGKPVWRDAQTIVGIRADAGLTPPAAATERLRARLNAPLPLTETGNLRLRQETLPKIVSDRTRREAYRLTIDNAEITLAAETENGLHHGLMTLLALINDQLQLPCVSILDWPDLEWRGAYVGGIAQAEEKLDLFAALKMNLLLLEDGNLFDLDNPETCARFQQLAQRCRDNAIEFVPELQSLGWGHFVLQREPRAVEARWVERAAFPVRNGQVYAPDPPMPAPPVVVNPRFEAGLQGWKAETFTTHWRPSSPEEASISETDGRQALQLHLTNTGIVRISQEIAVQPNAWYELRAMTRTQNVADAGSAYIEAYGINARGEAVLIGPNTRQVRGNSDWQEDKVQFHTGSRQPARPGGDMNADTDAQDKACEKVILYLRLEQTSGTVWFDDVRLLPVQAPNPLANAVVTDAAPVIVENEDGTLRYEAGRDYTVHAPELNYPYALGRPLEITLAENSRIHEGDTVLVSFNQADRDDITCCPSEPLYTDFLNTAITQVVEKLNPRYLHIGHDEPRFFNRDHRCTQRNLSNRELFADTIQRVHDMAQKANPEMRIMIWDDAVNPFQNAPHLDTVGVAEELPRDIIINIWWYDNAEWEAQIDQSADYFLQLGFEITGSPWFRLPTARHWLETLHTIKDNPKSRGIIYTSWDMVPQPWAALQFTAEQSWTHAP